MEPRSSARFVAYDLRPAKQCERRMMVDSFVAAMEAGFAIPSYRYVGMGANRFYDFIMIHKYLGIKTMISIEHDSEMFVRAQFNRPFDFISVRKGTVNDFILTDQYDGNSIYWLDYDAGISPEVTQDIANLIPSLSVGDFVFVTVKGSPPKRLVRCDGARRIAELREQFGDLVGSLDVQHVRNSMFPSAVARILALVFQRAFSTRTEGEFRPFFRVRYADGTEMVSLGGAFDGEGRTTRLSELLNTRMPFLEPGTGGPYKIGRFDYTDKERRLFDLAVTVRRKNAKELGQLARLGFCKDEIDRYRELLRYQPRYVETFI